MKPGNRRALVVPLQERQNLSMEEGPREMYTGALAGCYQHLARSNPRASTRVGRSTVSHSRPARPTACAGLFPSWEMVRETLAHTKGPTGAKIRWGPSGVCQPTPSGVPPHGTGEVGKTYQRVICRASLAPTARAYR